MRSLAQYLLVIVLVGITAAKGQQVPYIHQYQVNPFIYNPAAAGSTDYIQTFFIRNQKYLGFNGGNISNLLTADGKFFTDKMGFGLSLYNDNIGLVSQVGGSLAYSYKINFSDKLKLSFGIAAGAADKRFNFTSAVVQDLNDPVMDPENASRKTIFDLNAGLLFDAGNFRFGFSVPQVLGLKVKFGGDTRYQDERHFIGFTSYKFLLSEKLEMTLAPLAQAKLVPGAPFQFDAGVNFDMARFGWAMVSYNSGYGISANLGVRIKKNLMIGYAYDVVINSTSAYKPFNQEILVGYRFGQTSDPKTKKQLEEALLENERLRKELERKKAEMDSLNQINQKAIEDLQNQMMEKARQYEDSLKAMQEKLDSMKILQQKVEELKKQTSQTAKTNYNGNDPDIRKSVDDHFLETDLSTESPKGYYVIVGAYSRIAGAEQQLSGVKENFPDARLIFNERNRYYYVLLQYSEDKQVVFDAMRKAKSTGVSKAWILSY
jgi:type IX secretion system PorP/SprF family membrane protein